MIKYDGHEWLATSEVAERLGCHRDTARQLCEEGAFPGAHRLRRGGHWRVPAEDVERYRQKLREGIQPIRRRA